MTATDRQLVTYEEAAQRLGVSVRTVQRRVRDGQLTTMADNGRQLVVLPAVVGAESAPTKNNPANLSELGDDVVAQPRLDSEVYSDKLADFTAARLADLESRVADLEADRDHWRTMAAKLSDTVASQQQMIQGQFLERVRTDGRMLEHVERRAETAQDMPAPAHTTVAPPRRRWTLRDAYRRLRGR